MQYFVCSQRHYTVTSGSSENLIKGLTFKSAHFLIKTAYNDFKISSIGELFVGVGWSFVNCKGTFLRCLELTRYNCHKLVYTESRKSQV